MLSGRSIIALGLAAVAAAGAVYANASYRAAMRSARASADPRRSRLVQTRFGTLEYAVEGEGPPFLMVHGTGGGFDQGLMFAEKLVADGYRVIAPSRFGYLRSAVPANPSSEHQADAYADLLDALDIPVVAIAGGSAGALSAMQFAIRHPKRCAALFPIVPAAYAPNRPPARPWGPVQTVLAQSLLKSDFLFWAAITTMRDSVIRTLLATDPHLVVSASPEEQARVERILHGILPVSERAAGLINDARLAGNPASMDLEKISAPTLAISLEDDRFLTIDSARHVAATVPQARLIVFPTGGHVWVGHHEEIFKAIEALLDEIGYPDMARTAPSA